MYNALYDSVCVYANYIQFARASCNNNSGCLINNNCNPLSCKYERLGDFKGVG